MIKPNKFQKKKVAKGKLLHQRFRFKKDVVDEPTETPIYNFNATIVDLDKTSRNGVVATVLDDIETRIVPEDEMPTAEFEGIMSKLYDPNLEEEYLVEPIIDKTTDILREKYNELVTQLSLTVADRIKSFKKRNVLMCKLTGEEYGFLEHSNWATNETTTFKHWPASWKFERSIGTNTIFEARFNHATFELVSYRTIFMYDPRPKHVISRDPNAKVYSVDNDEDLVDIIAIYEKAIDFVYDYGKK